MALSLLFFCFRLLIPMCVYLPKKTLGAAKPRIVFVWVLLPFSQHEMFSSIVSLFGRSGVEYENLWHLFFVIVAESCIFP